MHHSCDYCGTELNGDVRGRFYPEDDSLLCEKCFPLVDKRKVLATVPAEKLLRAGRLPVPPPEEA